MLVKLKVMDHLTSLVSLLSRQTWRCDILVDCKIAGRGRDGEGKDLLFSFYFNISHCNSL